MKDAGKGDGTVLAAGGIVLRHEPEPLIAIVRLRKDKAWVLPKGKLKPGEDALAAARREATEETGHAVSAHEFLGALSYASGSGRPKVVQFWRMRAGGVAGRLAPDVKAVKWLPLDEAIERLTHAHERVFLESIGPVALKAARESAGYDDVTRPPRASFVDMIRSWLRGLARPLA
jgi:8-oxo-dGTP diphosphatase